ncbi:MAG: peptidoglycan-binding protein [Symploca sp. SIO3E6]|nr:peptidoglycan-binding protein [Caldora sp. SIO3E6]
METLAYFYLTATEQGTENQESVTGDYYSLSILQELKQPKLLNWVLISLSCLTVVTVLNTASPVLAMSKGDSGIDVTSLQEDLKASGYYEGPVTGFYGSLTEEAVIKFQNARGLVPDGIVGSMTKSALVYVKEEKLPQELPTDVSFNEDSRGADNSVLLLKRGNKNAIVASLQRNMQTSGYYNGPITGYYGSFTEAAVKEFQKAQGLQVDGVAGPVTRAALESSSGEGIPQQKVDNSPYFFNQDPFLEENESFSQPSELQEVQEEYPSGQN